MFEYGWFIVLDVVLFFAFFGWLIWSSVKDARQKQKGQAVRSAIIPSELHDISTRVFVSTCSAIAGCEIVQSFGIVRGISGTQVNRDDLVLLAEGEALRNLMQEALSLGANAVVDARLTSASYHPQSIPGVYAQLIYTGTAVVRRALLDVDSSSGVYAPVLGDTESPGRSADQLEGSSIAEPVSSEIRTSLPEKSTSFFGVDRNLPIIERLRKYHAAAVARDPEGLALKALRAATEYRLARERLHKHQFGSDFERRGPLG